MWLAVALVTSAQRTEGSQKQLLSPSLSPSWGRAPQSQRSGTVAAVAVRKHVAAIYPAPALQTERGL